MQAMAQRRTALITGSTSGIGEALSRVFAANAFDLVLVSRDAAELQEQKDRLERAHVIRVHVIARDLTAADAADAVYDDVQRSGHHVDVLVNNAGFNVSGPFCRTDMRGEARMMQLHMVCLTQLTKRFLPGMIGRRFGRILNVGSTGSFAPVPLDAVYAATKAYVLSFSSAIAAELRGTGVSVSTLCPGATRTAFARKAELEDTYLFRYFVMEPDAVARIGFRGLMRGRRVIIPGVLNWLLVASMPLTPAWVLDAVSTVLLSPRARRPHHAADDTRARHRHGDLLRHLCAHRCLPR